MPTEAAKPKEHRVGFFLPKEIRDDLKILAVKQGRTLQELATEAFTDFLQKNQEAA